MCSRANYAVSGTDLARGVMCPRACYAMFGTDIGVQCHPQLPLPTDPDSNLEIGATKRWQPDSRD
eukprot:2945024-Rhodomonas_salina.2